MSKETVPCNKTRVSPYPLRSSRTRKEKEPEPLVQTQSRSSQWEEIRCVICQEPPHNAILLNCSSNECRPYMCDTSARHSNCFKEYCKQYMNRLTKVISCPYCRGEVKETMKESDARRYLNAKPRSCTFEGCNFSGTYSQLNKHSKADHPGFTRPLVDMGRQYEWEQMQRVDEYINSMTAGLPHNVSVRVLHNEHPHSIPPFLAPHVRIYRIDHNSLFEPHERIRFGVSDHAASPLMPRRRFTRFMIMDNPEES